MQAWRDVVTKHAKVHTIGELKHQQRFCVNYSEFCKCARCEHTKNKVNALGPHNQNVQDKYIRVAGSRPPLASKNGTTTIKSTIEDKCVPLS